MECDMNSSFFSEEDLERLGFKSIGKNVFISRKASIYGAENITIGNNVRIDDFCILSGTITIGNYIHVAAYTALYGGNSGIEINDYANISSRVCIYALSDDYSGESMTSPMIPDEYKQIVEKRVIVEEHVIIGTGTTILPGVCLAQGTAIGAMSLVKKSTNTWTIYAGIPVKPISNRLKKVLELKKQFEKETNG